MPRVVALYRYPVKGFTPEPCTALTVLPEGRVAGDRVLAFRFANAQVADDQWCRKYEGIVLANTPGLARLTTQFDHHQLRLKIALDDRVLADEGLDAAGRKSLVAAVALRDPKLSDHRFRHNIVIEGVEAWEEQSWLGRGIRIGDVEFDVVKAKVRCLATHANPATGERDLQVMQQLMRAFAQKEPVLGIGMLTRGAGGEIRVGDSVSVIA